MEEKILKPTTYTHNNTHNTSSREIAPCKSNNWGRAFCLALCLFLGILAAINYIREHKAPDKVRQKTITNLEEECDMIRREANTNLYAYTWFNNRDLTDLFPIYKIKKCALKSYVKHRSFTEAAAFYWLTIGLGFGLVIWMDSVSIFCHRAGSFVEREFGPFLVYGIGVFLITRANLRTTNIERLDYYVGALGLFLIIYGLGMFITCCISVVTECKYETNDVIDWLIHRSAVGLYILSVGLVVAFIAPYLYNVNIRWLM